jgi:inactivated superfamily I helicase
MTLSDDKILVQMGSLREGKTLEECDKYIAGLKETINDMRRDKVKEFNTVAAEIAAYRRRFLQDPTRILAL